MCFRDPENVGRFNSHCAPPARNPRLDRTPGLPRVAGRGRARVRRRLRPPRSGPSRTDHVCPLRPWHSTAGQPQRLPCAGIRRHLQADSGNVHFQKVTGTSPSEESKVSGKEVKHNRPEPNLAHADLVAEYATVYHVRGSDGVTIQGLESWRTSRASWTDERNERDNFPPPESDHGQAFRVRLHPVSDIEVDHHDPWHPGPGHQVVFPVSTG